MKWGTMVMVVAVGTEAKIIARQNLTNLSVWLDDQGVDSGRT